MIRLIIVGLMFVTLVFKYNKSTPQKIAGLIMPPPIFGPMPNVTRPPICLITDRPLYKRRCASNRAPGI